MLQFFSNSKGKNPSNVTPLPYLGFQILCPLDPLRGHAAPLEGAAVVERLTRERAPINHLTHRQIAAASEQVEFDYLVKI